MVKTKKITVENTEISVSLGEATSALDEDTEAAMYALLAERLKQTTLVSIGHRSTLNKYHELMLVIDKQTKSVRLTKI